MVLAACRDASSPAPGTREYDEAVATFYTGVAAIQVGADERASRALTRFVELAPREPAGAANLAILAFQQRRFDDAADWIRRALEGAPADARVRILAALIERAAGRLDSAITQLERAVDAGEVDVRARFLLAQLLEQRADAEAAVDSRRMLDALLAVDSTNAFLLLESARHAARHSENDALSGALQRLAVVSAGWPDDARAQLDRVRAVAPGPDAGPELTLLSAMLDAEPVYARQRDAIAVSETQPDLIVTSFLRLPSPTWRPPAPDTALRWVQRPVTAQAAEWRDAQPVWQGGDGPARIALLEARSVLLAADSAHAEQRLPVPFTSGSPEAAVTIAALDFDGDFLMDLALAGGAGLRVFRQNDDGRFSALDPAALPPRTRGLALSGVWAADTDMDGDVDLVVAPRDETPFVLRNQGDGTFAELPMFEGVTGASQFLWADLDDDGDPDAVLLDGAGRVRAFANPRRDLSRFESQDPPLTGAVRAIAVGDMNGDATFDLLAIAADGAVSRSWMAPGGWRTEEIARWPDIGAGGQSSRLLVADLDNNGALDVAATSGGRTQIWLADSVYALVPHETLAVTVTAAVDLAGGGRIDLLGLDPDGTPVRLRARPSRDYYALTIAARATDRPGDGRINTFGIGGEAEVRAGMLYQKQQISAPYVHFGIGENTGVTVARIIWPNGTAQAEFDLLPSQGRPIVTEQRLKGSCPWLFAFDGREMRFVTDVAWRTALGLRINTIGATSVIHSEDWVMVRGHQLVPRMGHYELSITAELWESHFFDHVSLMVVDHPADTRVYVDERFALPPPELKLHSTATPSPVAGAWDDAGRDVTGLVNELDERYVDTFELGDYQGVARDHFLEVDLGAGAPGGSPLFLIAEGWVYPTDGSINLAIGQGRHDSPHGLRVDVPDGRGGWRMLHADLGMPSGKTKTVLIDLTGAFAGDTPRRVRLATNMETYWDRITWAESKPETEMRVTRLPASQADLRFRGLSRTHQAGRRAPELPDYEIAGNAQVWRDLVGFYTRFGDVRPLLSDVDDRYVIMNAGDELVLGFDAQPDPPAGWVRDFVLTTDAWVKDGDLNNGFSRTLMPLPYHGLSEYSRPPHGLQNDPAYRMHPEDWRDYHTRYVTPTRFHDALSR